MSTQRFSTDNHFIWQNVPFRVRRLLPRNQLELESQLDGHVEVAAFITLFAALANGTLSFTTQPRVTKTNPTPTVTLEDYTPEQQATINYRYAVIKPLLNIPVEDRKREDVIKRVEAVKAAQKQNIFPQKSVSVSSVYRWLKDYTAGGNDVRALLPQKRQSKPSSGDVVEKIIQNVIEERYLVRERVKIDDIWHEACLRIDMENRLRSEGEKLAPPSRTTVWRRVDKFDLEGKLTAKKGRREAKKALSQYGQMEYPRYPLERVEIDHTLTDLFVVDDEDNLPLGRLTLTYCLDVTTRYPLGFYLGFEPPSHLTVSSCLHHAILPKPDVIQVYGTSHKWLACGIPNMLVVDNGKEFISASLRNSCLSLGVVLQQLPVKTPHFKATVERMFSTLNTGLFHMLPGTTFSNFAAKGDYDSLRYASLRREEVNQLLHLFLIDVYAESFHRGLGAVPARRWEAATEQSFFPRVPENPEDLSILLARSAERAINPYGIEFESLRYNCDELSLLRYRLKNHKARQGHSSTRIKIKYLPDDLSHLFVLDPFEQVYIKVPALDQHYTAGLSLWSHQIIRKEVLAHRDRVNIKALAEAKRKIQEIVDQSKQRSKRKQTRKKVARWEAANGDRSIAPPIESLPARYEIESLSVSDNEGWSLELPGALKR